jgi:hypothetical protein
VYYPNGIIGPEVSVPVYSCHNLLSDLLRGRKCFGFLLDTGSAINISHISPKTEKPTPEYYSFFYPGVE